MKQSEIVSGIGEAGAPYPWLAPSTVKRSGKYRVTVDHRIRLVQVIDRRERVLLTTDDHPELVAMVARVKKAHGDPPSGVFYINEWKHVLVKAGGGTWYAGKYFNTLEFNFDGRMISPVASRRLAGGDPWPGPGVGITYTLVATGDDIYCRVVHGNRERKEYLSDYQMNADSIVAKWARFKRGGGRLYINEERELFTPNSDGTFLYVGRAATHEWFPEPHVG